MRFLAVTAITLGTLGAIPAADPPKATLAPTVFSWDKAPGVLGAVVNDLPKTTGVTAVTPLSLQKTKCEVKFDKTPFWDALQQCADKTNTRIALSEGGRKVELVPRGNAVEIAATSGAFRVVAQQVVGRALLDQGVTFHDVFLLVHWEPRLRVYRIDTAPKVTKVTDASGAKITVEGGSSQVLPTNATSEMRVRLSGLPRKSDRITSLAGEFTVTAADKMLAFAFEAPDGKLPDAQKRDNVSATLRRLQKKNDAWTVEVEVTYPKGQPVFQSHEGEWWLRDNRMQLVSPKGEAVTLDDYEIPTPGGNPLVVIHRFKEDAKAGFGDPTVKGWKIVYETPSPLVEVKVPFELKGLPLP